MSDLIVPRTPWPPIFPDVAVHCALSERDGHADFAAAKSGDRAAALRLAIDLISDQIADRLDIDWGMHAILLPVAALEVSGFNAIPDAMAQVLAQKAGLPVMNGQIGQLNRVGHTRASGWHRLVTPALFRGPVERGRDYILVDDHIGLGGTMANLRGHVEAGGGRVVAMTTLTESREARTIAVRPDTLNVLRMRHGQDLEDFWRAVFGHGLDCLTNVEAAYLARQLSFDAIRVRMAEAAEQARRRGLPAIEIGG
jgi:hypothetical protein